MLTTCESCKQVDITDCWQYLSETPATFKWWAAYVSIPEYAKVRCWAVVVHVWMSGAGKECAQAAVTSLTFLIESLLRKRLHIIYMIGGRVLRHTLFSFVVFPFHSRLMISLDWIFFLESAFFHRSFYASHNDCIHGIHMGVMVCRHVGACAQQSTPTERNVFWVRGKLLIKICRCNVFLWE